MLRVFLSSTYEDLEDIRSVILKRSIGSLNMLAMENFVAGNIDVQEKIFFDENTGLIHADLCIFLLTTRYGSLLDKCNISEKCLAEDCPYKAKSVIESEDKISYTHCEYRFFKAQGKHHQTFIFMDDWRLLSKLKSDDWDYEIDPDCKNISLETPLSKIECSKIREIATKKKYLMKFWQEFSGEHFQRLSDNKKKHETRGLTDSSVHYIDEENIEKVIGQLADLIIQLYREGSLSLSDFVGRKEELCEIIEFLEDDQSVEVWGIGGIGKTTLIHVVLLIEQLKGRKIVAIGQRQSYISGSGYSSHKKVKQNFSYADIPFRTIKGGKMQLNDVADALEIPIENRSTGYQLLEDIVRLIEKDHVVLFIDDIHNADESVLDLLTMNIPVVVTSREDTGYAHQQISLGPVSEEDQNYLIDVIANRLLKQKREEIPDEIRKIIIKTAGGHPVITHLLINNYERIPFESFKNIRDTLKDAKPRETEQILDRIVREILDKDSFRLLSFLAILNPLIEVNINRKIVEAVYDLGDSKELFKRLIDCGFIRKVDLKERYIFTFRHIQEAILSDDPELHKYAVDYYHKLSNSDVKNFNKIELLFHKINITIEDNLTDEFIFLSQSDNNTAVESLRLIDIGKKLVSTIDSPKKGTIYLRLAWIQYVMSLFSEARETYCNLIDFSIKGNNLPYLSQGYRDYGNMLRYQGEYEAAEILLTKSIQMWDLCDPIENASEIAYTYYRIGKLYDIIERENLAETFFIKALSIFASIPDNTENFFKISRILNDYGLLNLTLNNEDKAENLILQAITNLEENYDPIQLEEKTEYAEVLMNYALILHCKNNYSESESFYKKALNIENKLVRKNPEVHSISYANMLETAAAFCVDIDKKLEADCYHEQAIEIYLDLSQKNPEAYGMEYINSIVYAQSIGIESEKIDDDISSSNLEESLVQCRNLCKKSPEKYNFRLAKLLYDLGNIEYNKNRYDLAEEYYLESVSLLENIVNNVELAAKRILSDIFATLSKIENFKDNRSKFIEYLKKSTEVFKRLIEISSDPERYQLLLSNTNAFLDLWLNELPLQPILDMQYDQEGSWDLLKNSAGDLLIAIRSRDNEPENPYLVVDGGEHALLVRNPKFSVILDYIHPDAQTQLQIQSKVLIAEFEEDDFVREYMTPVKFIRSLSEFCPNFYIPRTALPTNDSGNVEIKDFMKSEVSEDAIKMQNDMNDIFTNESGGGIVNSPLSINIVHQFEQEASYDVLQNTAGDLLIAIRSRKDKPENPHVIYDGGEHALLQRNGKLIVVLDYLHPDARTDLKKNNSVLIAEFEEDDFVREYLTPITIVSSIFELYPDLTDFILNEFDEKSVSSPYSIIIDSEFEQEASYDVLQNTAGDLLIAIRSREDEPENPHVIYDGGEHALLQRNGKLIVVLDYLHPDARTDLKNNNSVLIAEFEEDDLVREYLTPITIVSSIFELYPDLVVRKP